MCVDQLKPLIRDDTVTVHFVDALYKRFLDLKTAQLQKTLAASTAAKRPAEVSSHYSKQHACKEQIVRQRQHLNTDHGREYVYQKQEISPTKPLWAKLPVSDLLPAAKPDTVKPCLRQPPVGQLFDLYREVAALQR